MAKISEITLQGNQDEFIIFGFCRPFCKYVYFENLLENFYKLITINSCRIESVFTLLLLYAIIELIAIKV